MAVADGPTDGATDSVGVGAGVAAADVDDPVVLASDDEVDALLPEVDDVGGTVGWLTFVVPADAVVVEEIGRAHV